MTVPCYHCGQPVPPGLEAAATVLGQARPMCCLGCKAVAEAIVAGGHESYYRHRSAPAQTAVLVPELLERNRAFDHQGVQAQFVSRDEGGRREAALMLEGITCAACVWLNERHLRELDGVLEVQVNYATHRARVVWDERKTHLSDILAAVAAIGYRAHPYQPERRQRLMEQERKRQLRRLGLAGILGMQVMTLAVALYFGDAWGIEPDLRHFMQWTSLALSLPILGYSAAPFYRAAWRDLRRRRVGMDVPVALGMGGAFAASLANTLQGSGPVYYDSVAMFTFFLLTARYFELSARARAGEAGESLLRLAPATATRLDAAGGEQEVAVVELAVGERVRVLPGATVPTDGEIVEGHSSVDESLLSGESQPLPKAPGDTLIGGSVNIDSPLLMRVTRVGADTLLSQMLRLLDRAQSEKPALTRLADRVAAGFVAAVLVLAAGVAWYWWSHDPRQWLPVTVAVLVVTCPCALSLAMPTALTAATAALARDHLLVTRGHTLETLARVTDLVFDKTGTLTQGRAQVTAVEPAAGLSRERVLGLAAALERHSEHPIARALVEAAGPSPWRAEQVASWPGQGLRGRIEGRDHWLGNAAFLRRQGLDPGPARVAPAAAVTEVLLADAEATLGRIELRDRLRPDAEPATRALRGAGLRLHLLSGDREAVAARVAAELGITQWRAGQSPQDKLAELQRLQAGGAVVGMVGDGVNDAPVLAGAAVSVAMGGGTAVAMASADMILMANQLSGLVTAVDHARKTLRVIRQNLVWALGYNLLALPAAAAGWVTPWMAAIGMSLSSLIVVANASRLNRVEPRP